MATREIIALDTATPQLRAPGTGDTYIANRTVQITPESGAALSVTAPIVSTLATGTAPLTVSSTTMVANLNAATAGTATTAGALSASRSITMTGDVTWTTSFDGSSNVTAAGSIAASSVTLVKQADVATATVFYRKTAGTGAPEVQTLATLKTDLGLTGTNSGDQTTVTGNAGTATALATGRTIAMTGDVTWTTPTFDGTGNVTAAGTIAAGAVTIAKQANVATATIRGRVTAGTGVLEDMTGTQTTTLLDSFTSALKGLAPASGGGTTNFLRADGTWAAAGGGSPGGSTTQLQYNNAGAFGGMSGTAWDNTNRSLVVTGATVTTSNPIFDLSQTWNAGAVAFTAVKVNVTDTASTSASQLIDLQVAGVSKFKVSKTGVLVMPNGILVNNMSLGYYSTANIDMGSNSSTITFGGGFDVTLSRKAAANLQLGGADAAAPVAQTLSVQSVVAVTSNTAGAKWTFAASQGTGTGVGGDLDFQVAPAGSSGSTPNALVTGMRVYSNQTVLLGKAHTVSTLPVAGTAGRRTWVSDALAPTFLGTLTGGGAVVTPVFDNGTAWVAG